MAAAWYSHDDIVIFIEVWHLKKHRIASITCIFGSLPWAFWDLPADEHNIVPVVLQNCSLLSHLMVMRLNTSWTWHLIEYLDWVPQYENAVINASATRKSEQAVRLQCYYVMSC